MLTLAPIHTPERVLDHFSPVHRYGGTARPSATWFGTGAAVKGLRNPVDPACLLPLLDGRIDEETLLGSGKGDNRKHRPGWELTFSAPKSLSLVALAGDDERLLAAHNRAVRMALKWLETNIACNRLEKCGKSQRHLTGCFLAVIVRHELSCAGEPHLHSRVLLVNATLAGPGQWRSLYSLPLYHAVKRAGSRYQQRLAKQAQSCGYDVCWYDNGTFELAVIPRRLILLFSNQTKSPECQLDEQEQSRTTAYGKQCKRATRQTEATRRRRALALQRKQDQQRAAKARINLTAVVARARQRSKAPPDSRRQSAVAASTRAAGC